MSNLAAYGFLMLAAGVMLAILAAIIQGAGLLESDRARQERMQRLLESGCVR
jgi:hypothetical protein